MAAPMSSEPLGSYDRAASREYAPDTALVHFYDSGARLGQHRDKDETTDAPVVSLSVGDACVFRFGDPGSLSRPWTDIRIEGGDPLV